MHPNQSQRRRACSCLPIKPYESRYACWRAEKRLSSPQCFSSHCKSSFKQPTINWIHWIWNHFKSNVCKSNGFQNTASCFTCVSPVVDSLCWWRWPDICSSTAHRPRSLSHWSIWWGRAGGCSGLTHCTDRGSRAPPVGERQNQKLMNHLFWMVHQVWMHKQIYLHCFYSQFISTHTVSPSFTKHD